MIPPKKNNGRPSKRPPESVLAQEYAEHTAKEIAEKYGVAESTVKRWISNYRKADRKELKAKK